MVVSKQIHLVVNYLLNKLKAIVQKVGVEMHTKIWSSKGIKYAKFIIGKNLRIISFFKL